jgi:hypothetical protein
MSFASKDAEQPFMTVRSRRIGAVEKSAGLGTPGAGEQDVRHRS